MSTNGRAFGLLFMMFLVLQDVTQTHGRRRRSSVTRSDKADSRPSSSPTHRHAKDSPPAPGGASQHMAQPRSQEVTEETAASGLGADPLHRNGSTECAQAPEEGCWPATSAAANPPPMFHQPPADLAIKSESHVLTGRDSWDVRLDAFESADNLQARSAAGAAGPLLTAQDRTASNAAAIPALHTSCSSGWPAAVPLKSPAGSERLGAAATPQSHCGGPFACSAELRMLTAAAGGGGCTGVGFSDHGATTASWPGGTRTTATEVAENHKGDSSQCCSAGVSMDDSVHGGTQADRRPQRCPKGASPQLSTHAHSTLATIEEFCSKEPRCQGD